MTTLLKSKSERAVLLENAPVQQASDSAQVNIVILAGGFNTDLVHEIIQKNKNDTLVKDTTATMLRKTKDGVTHVPAGLITVGEGGHSLASVTNALHTVHQCSPLTESLYLVTNAQNHDEYAGPAGFFDDIGRFSRDWQASHTFCNGCRTPGEWRGHAADLAMAMRRIAEGNGPTAAMDTIAIDANLFMWPKFNLQKLVSNLYIRARNTIAVQQLTESDANLLPAEVTLATLAASGQVPRLAALHPRSIPAPGAFAVRPVAYLEASSVPVIEEIVREAGACGGGAGVTRSVSLEEVFGELQRRAGSGEGGPVFGAVVPWGMFDTQTLICVRYAHDYVLLQSKVLQRLEAPTTSTLASDTMTKMMQVTGDGGLGKCKLYDPDVVTARLKDTLDTHKRDFDRFFFAMESTRFRGLQMPAYKLPSTFYMTTYRAQTAEGVV